MVDAGVMPRWFERLLDDLGRHIVRHGWADPFSSIPPMIVSDELDDAEEVDEMLHSDQEFTANSSR